jgi:hypothetical protein
MTQARNQVSSYNDRAVQPDEMPWVESILKRSNGLVEQVTSPVDMEPHIVALGFDFIDVIGTDTNKIGFMGYPKLV